MTREEAIEILLDMANDLQIIPESKQGQAFKMALKSLDNEKVIDTIRAEIVELWKNEPCAIDGGCLDEMLQIIDKYRGESDCRECKAKHDYYECKKYEDKENR